jgi:phenylpropionate dioxygenase-like ring-hydroxylating dioxygenase large terminal subunit
MFIHQSKLEHLLRPDQYFSQEQHDTELRHLFAPAWHPVTTIRRLAWPGHFVTLDLFGRPLLLRNMDGEICAFLNVCPHRHSTLTDKECGNTDKLKCQYHGWEYKADGRTGQIPDARAFRPWDRDNACLRKFRVDRCGEIVFVCLDDTTPPLREFVGPLWDGWEQSFGGRFRFSAAWEQDFPCNWKVVLENSLESYHIPQVHPKTFKVYPDEPMCRHHLDPRYTTFTVPTPDDWIDRATAWLVRRLGEPVCREYQHHNLHPHLTVGWMDVSRVLMWVVPTSPTTSRYRAVQYVLRGRRRNPMAWGLSKFFRLVANGVAKKVFAEDGSVYAGVQKGLEASPHRGVIGTREERIYVFQKYVLEKCEPRAKASGAA